jgi:hypothetical protein|tara:strand:- start:41 stop:679 length:639 start_codon:yes stop_codon:yes gene_type:complete
MKISYGLTVCNEHAELENLITFLSKYPKDVDEIVIVYDQNRVTPEVLDVIEKYKDSSIAHPFDFKQNFLENKNYLNSKCTGDYIFQIDADEVPHEVLVQSLKQILSANPVELLITSRVNRVEGLTQEHINKWNWRVNEQGWVNFPDAQKRIYKNDPSIKWSGHQVHGMVEGFKTYVALPFEERFSIYHNKQINRQEQQNARYAQIENERQNG